VSSWASAWVSAWVSASLLVGCSRPPGGARLAPPPAVDPADQLGMGNARCSVAASHDSPFVVEWEGSQRAQLEAAIRKGVVAVRYGGCELEVVQGCTAPQPYDYAALTPKKESVEILDADELYARFPRGAVGLEADLERAGSLAVDMMLVGRLEAPSIRVEREQLQGSSCAQATHVVSGLTVGAFRLHTGSKEDIEVDLSLPGEASVGGQRLAEREELGSDGDVAACEAASSQDVQPPPGCGALIRIEVVPLGDFERQREVADASRPFYAKGTPWRKPAVIGTAALAASVPGQVMMILGMVLTSDADTDPFNDVIEDPRTRAKGVALIAVGAPIYFAGTIAGATFLIIAAVRKRRAKQEAGLVMTPTGLGLRF
jgi:hypothetical protein